MQLTPLGCPFIVRAIPQRHMVGGISLIWAIPTNSAVLERYAHAGINERNASLGDSAVNGILARRIAVSELVNTHERVVDRIIRHLQGSHRQASGGVLPAPVPALGEQPQAAPAAAHPDGGPGGRHQGRSVVPPGPPGYHPGWRNGHGQDLHRRRRRRRPPTRFRRILVLCPPHLTRKWKREVEETVPQARAAIVTSITDLERLRLSVGPAPLFAVMSRERAKLSYRWSPAVIQRWAAGGPVGAGRADRGTLPGALLPLLSRSGGGQGRGSPDQRGAFPQAPRLRPVRLRALESEGRTRVVISLLAIWSLKEEARGKAN